MPDADTVKVAVCPTNTLWSAGCMVIAGMGDEGDGGEVAGAGALPPPPQAANSMHAINSRATDTRSCMAVDYMSPKCACSQTTAAIAAVSVRKTRGPSPP